MTRHSLDTPEAVCLYMFAGKAIVTLESPKTGARFTYRVKESADGRCHFVSVLTGPDNGTDYDYLGYYREGIYRHGTRKSLISATAPSAVAFEWFARQLAAGKVSCRVYHEGRCGACGRRLTVPESILTGLGPECSGRLGVQRAVVCEQLPL